MLHFLERESGLVTVSVEVAVAEVAGETGLGTMGGLEGSGEWTA